MMIAYSGAKLKMENVNRTGNGSGSSSQVSNPGTSETPDASDDENRSGESSVKTGSDITSNVKPATGPRTQLGKERSKHNALKHGVFSNVAVLKDESQDEFDSLLNGFREDYQPEGTLEEVLVEKLAMILWRHRRVLIAERAEIRKGADSLNWNQKPMEHADPESGLMDRINDPSVLDRCLDLLDDLAQDVVRNGFSIEQAYIILRQLYGESGLNSSKINLCKIYEYWLGVSKCPEEERKREGYATPQECTHNVLKEICRVQSRLRTLQKIYAEMAEKRSEIEKLRQCVPDDPRAERLLRYEASLERNFDRALNQLERAQRIRKGQAVLPTVKLDISQ
jgi:hypothetical protein